MSSTISVYSKKIGYEEIYNLVNYDQYILYDCNGKIISDINKIFFNIEVKKYIKIKDNIILRLTISSTSESGLTNRHIIQNNYKLLNVLINSSCDFIEDSLIITNQRKEEIKKFLFTLIENYTDRFDKGTLQVIKLILL